MDSRNKETGLFLLWANVVCNISSKDTKELQDSIGVEKFEELLDKYISHIRGC